MNLKLINAAAVICLLTACKQSKPLPASVQNFNSFPGTDITLFVSCNKCDCIITALNDYFAKHPFNKQRFTLYGDTICLKHLTKNVPVTFLSQKAIDSCSMDFYNLLVRTKKGNEYFYKQVTTKKAGSLPSFLED